MDVIGVSPNKLSNTLVESCEFRDNTAQVGGAVEVINNNVNFECCNFNNNFSSIAAGALSAINIFSFKNDGVKGVVNVNKSTFTNNVTAGDTVLSIEQDTAVGALIDLGTLRSHEGGGACSVHLDGILNIHNSTFEGNVARKGDGGALLNGRSKLKPGFNNESAITTVSDCKFLNNTALFGNGGAIANIGDNNVKLVIRDTKFKCNRAPNGKGNNVYESAVIL